MAGRLGHGCPSPGAALLPLLPSTLGRHGAGSPELQLSRIWGGIEAHRRAWEGGVGEGGVLFGFNEQSMSPGPYRQPQGKPAKRKVRLGFALSLRMV